MKVNETNYNDKAVKEICYNCGSPTAKKSYNYFRRLEYLTGGKVWSKDGEPIGFFYALTSKDKVRLIEIAVKIDFQRQGIGKQLLCRLAEIMREYGFDTLTFKTPMKEDAYNFWLKIGAKIIDVNGADYEMEIKYKI